MGAVLTGALFGRVGRMIEEEKMQMEVRRKEREESHLYMNIKVGHHTTAACHATR